MSYKYLHYYLLCIKHIIQEEARYTTGNGNVNMDHFRNLKIKVLKPEIRSYVSTTSILKYENKLFHINLDTSTYDSTVRTMLESKFL
jgi:hypothetical protein